LIASSILSFETKHQSSQGMKGLTAKLAALSIHSALQPPPFSIREETPIFEFLDFLI